MNDYQFMPPLSDDEYDELKKDIAERGVMVPVEIDEAGKILDGHHRVKICRELGIEDFPTICREGLTEEEKITHARKLNMARRHLSQEQKRELIREQIKETPEKSDRQIASDLGVDHVTVGTQRKGLEGRGEIHHVETVTDTLGREQPRERKAQKTDSEEGDTAEVGAQNTTGQEEQSTLKSKTRGTTKTPMPTVQEETEEKYTPPRKMTPVEDLSMALADQVKGQDSVLSFLLNDYEGDKGKKEMLFSDEGIKASLEGLSKFKGMIEKYEQLVKARK